jgi:hypothetical protein
LWNTGEVYTVELYARVRRAVVVDNMSESEAARKFGLARETVTLTPASSWTNAGEETDRIGPSPTPKSATKPPRDIAPPMPLAALAMPPALKLGSVDPAEAWLIVMVAEYELDPCMPLNVIVPDRRVVPSLATGRLCQDLRVSR